jgi:hypothetical protein
VFWALHKGSAKAGNPNERLYTVQRGTLAVDVTESGAIEPVRTVEIKSRVSGRLAALYVEEGSRVRQGHCWHASTRARCSNKLSKQRAGRIGKGECRTRPHRA